MGETFSIKAGHVTDTLVTDVHAPFLYFAKCRWLFILSSILYSLIETYWCTHTDKAFIMYSSIMSEHILPNIKIKSERGSCGFLTFYILQAKNG